MYRLNNTIESSSPEETRCQFNGGTGVIKLGIDVHQDFYVVVMQEGGSNPKPPQRFRKEAFLTWAAKLKGQAGQCTPFMKRADLVSDCSERSARSVVMWKGDAPAA